ncbi:MAG: glycosyltransferase family protein, partial [Candidatus Eiseniibacteriota bacterium]
IRAIRDAVPSVKLVLGWMGSLLPDGAAWHQTDLMLSCAPEIVEILERRGHRAAQLHHGYDPRVDAALLSRTDRWELSFVGQIPVSESTHTHRAALLDRVRTEADLAIFSPDGSPRPRDAAKVRLRAVAGMVGRGLLRAGLPEQALHRIPKLARAALDRPAGWGLPRGLKAAIRPPVFGLAMYQVLRDSRATLNIHADFSPRFACNMRLYEATGVGTCLVTDWKENLGDLFEIDREVVSFRTADELVEKVRWLAANPEARAAIGDAGQRRTLRDHTFARRAERLDALIRERLR